ncbi:SMC-Scp complex subunit ScpB [archaeon]|jgi:segregation and condensation protein B|nr:SMC-Scp complex subunit ScpB [archaeon]MBT4241882.1 SMC-Scp complex subunit ScpB [archaeon]MBT4418429.1 SMC-Scp complex subunit ScpB [archaeon]
MEKENIVSSETVKEIDESNEVENLKKVEAALFISARFLTLNELVLLTDVNPLMIKELLEKLILKYNQDESAIEIVVRDGMWKMDVRQEYVSMINKLATGSSEFSKAEQETLAVIAYKQPVKQSVIIKIRGNKAYEHIKNFIGIGLVQAKRAGHTKELSLSDDFFEYFHVQDKGGSDEGSSNSEESEELKNADESIPKSGDLENSNHTDSGGISDSSKSEDSNNA